MLSFLPLESFIHSVLFPSAWRISLCLVTQSCLTLCDPMDCSPTRLLCPWGFSRQEYLSKLPCPPPEDLPNPGIEPRSPALQVDSLSSESPGKWRIPLLFNIVKVCWLTTFFIFLIMCICFYFTLIFKDVFAIYIYVYTYKMKVKVKVSQFCLTLCDPVNYTVHEIL